MIKQFLSLELKSFFRSSAVGKSIALKVFLGFLALYFSLTFLGLGIMLYEILKKLFPSNNHFFIAQNYIGIWIISELVLRFFMQSLPVINMKSFLTQNVKKCTIIHFVLTKSVFSYYNLIVLFFSIPFAIISVSNNAVSGLQAVIWVLSMFIISLIINYINFLIKKSFTTHFKKFLPLAVLALIFVALEYFSIFNSS